MPSPSLFASPSSVDKRPRSRGASVMVRSHFWRQRIGLLLFGVGVGAMALGAAAYAITRPCVVGGCVQMDQATALEGEALQRLRNEPSTVNLERSWDQIAIARDFVMPIPAWSRHGAQASDRQKELTAAQDDLREVIAVLSIGWEASQLSQSPPHPLERWQQLEELWGQAITQLEQIPETNVAYPVVLVKLNEYRDHLDAIRRRTVLEQRAEESVAAARLAAQVAGERQTSAVSLEELQQAHASWQLAIESLMRVPGGTTGAEAAQTLLEEYTPQRDSAQRQQDREQTGALRYRLATEAADRARVAVNEKRWEQAIGFWQQAIAHVREVPTQSTSAENARAALESHTRSLAQTIAKQEMAQMLEQTSKNLAEFCTSTTQICSYTVSESRLVVKLRADYLATVRRLDQQAAANRSVETRVQLEQHLQSTIDALKTISDSSGIAIDVLDPQGQRLAQYTPGG
jgi:hypothetical protein